MRSASVSAALSALLLIGSITAEQALSDQGSSPPCEALGCAIRASNEKLVEELLSNGADPSNPSTTPTITSEGPRYEHLPPLAIAIEGGHETIALMLLRAGADPTLGPSLAITALELSVDKSLGDVVKHILENKLIPADGMGTEQKPLVPLSYAILNADTELMDYLIANGADPNRVTRNGTVSVVDEALAAGKEDSVRWLLDHGLDDSGLSPSTMNYAAAESHHGILKTLLKDHISASAASASGTTPLEQGAQNCRHQERVLEVLLYQGADPCEATNSGHPLLSDHATVGKDGINLLSQFSHKIIREKSGKCAVVRGPPDQVSARCDKVHGLEKLACAVEHNDYFLVGRMDQNGPEIQSELPALVDRALLIDSQETAIAMVDHWDQWCVPTSSGLPFLHRATTLGRYRAINASIIDGKSCFDQFGFTALHRQTLALDYEKTKESLSRGVNPNETDKFSFSALMFALAFGAEDFAFLLMNAGASRDTETSSGHTWLHFTLLGDAHIFSQSNRDIPAEWIKKKDKIDDRTPLLSVVASACPSKEMSRLIWAGADKCKRDKYGKNYHDYLTANTSRLKKRMISRALAEKTDPCTNSD